MAQFKLIERREDGVLRWILATAQFLFSAPGDLTDKEVNNALLTSKFRATELTTEKGQVVCIYNPKQKYGTAIDDKALAKGIDVIKDEVIDFKVNLKDE